MKKFFILLIVVLMLAGLTSTSFAGQGLGNGDCDQVRECDEDCVPDGDGPPWV